MCSRKTGSFPVSDWVYKISHSNRKQHFHDEEEQEVFLKYRKNKEYQKMKDAQKLEKKER